MTNEEIIARAICLHQGKNPTEPYMPNEIPKGIKATDVLPLKWMAYEPLCKKIIAALTEAGIMLLTKQEAIDYVFDLPVDELGDTVTYPASESAGKRLRELQKAMIGAGK